MGARKDGPQLTFGQTRTARLFEGLGVRIAEYVVQMHSDEDRAERSSSLLDDAGDAIRAAIISGRQPESWLPSTLELNFLTRGMTTRLKGRYSAARIAEIAETEMRPLLETVGSRITVPRQIKG